MARTPSTEGRALKLKDLAIRWGVSRATVYRWRRDREIPPGDIGPRRRIYSERLVERIEDSHVVEDAPRKRAVSYEFDKLLATAVFETGVAH
jgi:predicted DNA-binding transcriptional regulator AlpA